MSKLNLSPEELFIFNLVDQDVLDNDAELQNSAIRLTAFVDGIKLENDWKAKALANKTIIQDQRKRISAKEKNIYLEQFDRFISGALGLEAKGLALGHCRERKSSDLTDDEKIKIAKDVEFLLKE